MYETNADRLFTLCRKNHSKLFSKQLGLSIGDVNERSRSWGPVEVLTLTIAGNATSGKAIECACTEKYSNNSSKIWSATTSWDTREKEGIY